jgi:subtilisin family serine protease
MRRVGVAAVAVAAMLPVTALLPAAAQAAPATASAPTGPATSPAVVARHTVTLLTGDKVLVDTLADGRQSATVRPTAERADIAYQTRTVNGHSYVIPSDAIPLLAAGKLDDGLFDVTQLIADGYDDARAATTPLIVQSDSKQQTLRAQAAPPSLPGTSRRYALESIHANAVTARKSEAPTLWKSMVDPDDQKLTATGQAVGKIWLDGKVKTALADSVPQIGAPQAWAAGYNGTGVKVAVLDTGIDTSHPDLADRVVAAQNFSTDTDTADHFGHGTHVASIVAGSGAASGGSRKGVAPGASLINAKVLNSGGSGTDSTIIEGMEWAAAQGAKVANMSLGTHSPSRGDDPLVQAVDEISKSTGMLFVIAADNIGPGDSTITSPGWADEALTVGAVDKQDALAGFSSRGPRLGDYGIKPDITAPGVDIIAARAEGTSIGPVVDGNYMQLSGTSMAAPHVAGAAAILAQEHPGYTNQQLKDLLISTAKIGEYSAYQQGGGRVDVARASAQSAYASPGTLNLGYFTYPHTDQKPVTKTVTYHNDGAADQTFALSLDVKGKKGTAAPAGMFTVDQSSVTVPAGGTASVNVTVDPLAGPFDLYGGYLVATAGDTVVHTTVGAYVEAEMYNVTVPGIARDGRQASSISQVELWGPAIGGFQTGYYSGGNTPTFRVPPGTYSLMGYLFTTDAPGVYALEATIVGNPQLVVTGDTTVTLDARPAKKIDIQTPDPTEQTDYQLGYRRDLGGLSFDSSFLISPPISKAYAVPTQAVTEGYFEFWHKWNLIAPKFQIKVTKPEPAALDTTLAINSGPLDGTFTTDLVYAGFGRPEEFANIDARGKVALISRGQGVPFVDKIRAAADAGASAAIIFNNVPGLLFISAGNPGEVPIPVATLQQADGLALVDQLAKGPITVQYTGATISPYQYSLMFPNVGKIAADQTQVINSRNTARIDTEYAGQDEPITGSDIEYAIRPWTDFLFGGAHDLTRPLNRTEYVSADPEIWWWHLTWANYPFDGEFRNEPRSYKANTRTAQSWYKQVMRPGIPAGLTGWEDDGTPAYREGDEFTVHVWPYVDQQQHAGWAYPGDVTSTQLYAGDRLLADTTEPIGTFPAVAGSATYRLTSRQQRSTPWWQYSTDVRTTWTFNSATPKSGRQLLPLLQVDYDVPLDITNRAKSGLINTFTLDVGHQPGVDGPAIKTVKAWVSYDDGAKWEEVPLVPLGDGKVLAVVVQTKPAGTSDAASLRVSATDTAGNSIDQTILRAFGLKQAG